MAVAVPRGRLRTAHEASTQAWQADLKTLFDHSKDRYPDVVWELTDGDNSTEEVWGHKAIVYARAPTAFQALYFSFRPANSASPNPYFQSPVPNGQSTYSVNIPYPIQSRSSSPFGDRRDQPSPTPSTLGGLLRLTTSVNPTLFSHELEYLYTGNGMGVAFEFLFDTPEQREGGESEEGRIDKLRKDLCYMWRSRLYSDVRIALNGGDFPSSATDTSEGDSAVVFFSHRFILVSRSPYFRGVLLSEFRVPTAPSGPITLNLPSTAFTPASLHWSLGFMYSGTLNFSHRTFDLDTAFAIVRSAAFLSLATMSDEIEAYIVEEMMHGLFHAYLTFDEYEKITAGKWGVGGCKCRQCQRRMPRILDFALSPDVPNRIFEKGARRALVGMFGEGWCSREFANLPAKMRASLLKGVVNRTSPLNIFPLLFASETALSKIKDSKDDWVDSVREMIVQAQKKIDEVLCSQTDICFEQQEWLEIMDSDGLRFGDRDKLQWIMEAIKRGLKDNNAGNVYQCLVSSVLLRPHPTDPMSSFLPNGSPVRLHVEGTRVEILRWLRIHWVQVRLVGGFDSLEQWALREIAQDLEIENENDLVSPPDVIRGPKTRAGLAAEASRDRLDPEMEVASMTSMRANVLNRNLAKSNADSTRSAATSASTSAPRRPAPSREIPATPRLANGSASPRRNPNSPIPSPIGASSTSSQLNLNTSLSRSGTRDTLEPSTSVFPAPSASPVPKSRRIVGAGATSASETSAPARPKSVTPSVRSNAATPTTRRNIGVPPPTPSSTASSTASSRTTATSTSTAKPKPSLARGATPSNAGDTTPRASIASRPVSSAATSFDSASSELQIPPRQRTLSAASATSVLGNAPIKIVKPRSPSIAGPSQRVRPRRTSTASVASVASSVASPKGLKPLPATTSPEIRLMPKRPSSQASVRSVRSTISTASKAPMQRKRIESAPKPPVPKLVTPKAVNKAPSVRSVASAKGKEKTQPSPKPEVQVVVLKRSTTSLKGKEKATTTKPPPSPKASPIVPEQPESKQPTKQPIKQPIKEPIKEPTPTSSVLSAKSDGASTIRGVPPGLHRKRSTDTVTEVSAVSAESNGTARPTHTPRTESSSTVKSNDTIKGPVAISSSDGTVPGVVLNVGIPCIITSKRSRFRAYARYLGDVLGEYGPWVGVEVPLSQAEKLQDRDWHDGTWGGVRYFDITRPEWEENDERMSKRRRLNTMNERRKRDGDTMSLRERRSNRRLRSVSPACSEVSMHESRGLFVRPNQVIYVIDAREDI